MRKKFSYLLVCLLFSLSVWGQNYEVSNNTFTDPNTGDTLVFSMVLQRSIELEGDSKAEDIIIDISGNIKQFGFSISTTVRTGKLTIEMYDSKGKKVESIAVGSQLSKKKSELVTGVISKELKEPRPGDWKIKILPNNATGTIKIITTELKQP